MYSKAYSDRRYAAGPENENISVPPRYGGVRFMKTARSDGREGGFEKNSVPRARQNAEEFTESVVDQVPFGTTDISSSHVPPDIGEGAKITAEAAPDAVQALESVPERKTKSPLSEILKSVGEDDILIIALILILAAEKGEGSREIILLLALLLCFR